MKPVLVQGGMLPDSFDRGSRFWQLANCVMEICTQKALPLHSQYSCTHVNHCYVVMNPLDPFQCSSLQTNMATLRGCSCCVNQGVGGLHSARCSMLQAVHTSLSRNQPQSLSHNQPQSLSHNQPQSLSHQFARYSASPAALLQLSTTWPVCIVQKLGTISRSCT